LSQTGTHALPGAAQVRRSRRPNLTSEQKREIVHLYTLTTTSVEDIRQRYAIGDSSLYRVLSQQGVSPRGRGGPSAAPPAPLRKTRIATAASRSYRYDVTFSGVDVVRAASIEDALRATERRGVTDVIQIERVA
jgi:transposase-like protein